MKEKASLDDYLFLFLVILFCAMLVTMNINLEYCFTTSRSPVLTNNSEGFSPAIYGLKAYVPFSPVSQVAEGGSVLLGIGGHDYIVAKDADGVYVSDGCFLP